MEPGFEAHPSGQGSMERRHRSLDWSATAVGSPEGWPEGLGVLVRTLLASPQPMVLFWGDERVQFWNDAFQELAPWSLVLGPIPGTPAEPWWSEAWPELEGRIRQACREGSSVWAPSTSSRGAPSPSESNEGIGEGLVCRLGAVPGESGKAEGVLAIFQRAPAPSRKEAELARTVARLEEERSRLWEIFRQAPSFMTVLHGPEHVFQYANAAFEKVVGGRPIVGMRVADALPEMVEQGFLEILDEVLATGEPFVAEGVPAMIQRDPDGEMEEGIFDFIYHPLLDPDGTPVGILTHGMDVTERHRAHERLRFQAALLDAVGEAVIATDLEGRILFWNRSAESIYGWSSEEALGRDVLDLTTAESARSEAEELLRELAEGQAWSGTFQLRRKDGRVFPGQAHTTPIHDEGGQVVGFVGVSSDQTERVAMEERLRKAQNLESVGRLSAGIAHDFNNLLTTILGNAELLRTDLTEDGLRDHVREIEEASRSAAVLVRKLLAFSRKQMLQPRTVSLVSMVEEMDGMLRQMMGEDIELSVSAPSDLWPVRADPGQLSLVLLNLTLNARDAMPQGGRLEIRMENGEGGAGGGDAPDDPGPGPYVLLQVRDTGEGMDPETLSHIFEPFFTTKEGSGGTGLGLPTVYGIIKQSGGHIQVTSEPGGGTTCRIHLPRAPEGRDSPTSP
jgi:PAS domain S-box-containing protein